jgi:hypothetical protein
MFKSPESRVAFAFLMLGLWITGLFALLIWVLFHLSQVMQ